MNRRSLIIIAMAALLVAAGCANKKKINPAHDSRIKQEQLTEAQRLEAEQRREAERLRIQDSIAQVEAAKRAMVQTMNIPRMTVTVVAQGKQISTPATMRWKRAQGTVFSIQPLAGIEIARIELNAQHLTILDKLNRRYTRLTYDDLAQMGARTSIDELDAWIDKNILARRSEPQLVLQVSQAGVSGAATIYTASMQTDVNVNLQPTNISNYRQVTLEQLLKGF